MSTPQEKPEYVLFFSMECKYSKNFVNKIKQKEELFKKFNLVDIDKLQVIPDEIDEIEVPCQSFSTLLDPKEIPNVGFILSDTEGYDSHVVEFAIESGCLPEFICFEFIHLKDRLRETCYLLSRTDYRYIYDKQNCLAYRESLFH